MGSTVDREELISALQQNPGLAVLMAVAQLAIFALILASLIGWSWAARAWVGGRTLLPVSLPWEPRRWSLVDVVVVFVMTLALQGIAVGLMLQGQQRDKDAPMGLDVAAAAGLASLIGVLLGVIWISLRYRRTAEHTGFGGLAPRLLATGLVSGVLLVPLTYLIMFAANAFWQTTYEHPLIESVSQGASLKNYLLGCFAAAFAAPIAEEFLFRVVLQGWLQSIPFKSWMENLLGISHSTIGQQDLLKPMEIVNGQGDEGSLQAAANSDQSQAHTLNQANLASCDLSSSSAPANSYLAVKSEAEDLRSQPKPPIWPSIIAGILFGLAHIEYGLSFIPLSLLGIGMGLVYRATHSIWPCICIHMMLNTISMTTLGLVILMKQASILKDAIEKPATDQEAVAAVVFTPVDSQLSAEPVLCIFSTADAKESLY